MEQRGSPRDLVFFTKIQSYFAAQNANEFWNSVLFFNFVPDVIGSDRFGSASDDQVRRGRERFTKILDEHQPDKVLMFTIKGWYQLCLQQTGSIGTSPIEVSDDDSKPVHGMYRSNKHPIFVYQLRHPQGATTDFMKDQVADILQQR